MRRLLYIGLLLLFSLRLWAAETIIIGEVYNASTGEPIPSANVYFRGTKIGMATNEEGLFMLRANLEQKQTMVVSAIGYRKQRFEIMPGMQAGIDVALQERTEVLPDIRVTPDDRDALHIISLVREHREQNDRQMAAAVADNYSEHKYLYLSHIRAKHLERFLWQRLREGMIEQPDSSYLLPLYLSSGTMQLQGGYLSPLSRNETRCVLTETDYASVLSLADAYVNFYKNTVALFGTAFISPLAAAGSTYYRYYLADSASLGPDSLPTTKRYILHFRTKNGYYPTFNGEMEVDSGTWVLRRVISRVPKEVNINYLHAVQLEQSFSEEAVLMREQQTIALDFAVKADSSHIFPSLIIERRLDYLSSEQGAAPMPAHEPDTAAIAAMQRLEELPVMRVIKWGVNTATTGYMSLGTWLDIGRITEIFRYNKQNGLYLALPLHTNEKLWKHVSLDAYVGYGFGDRHFKGMGQVSLLVPSERRNLLTARYEDNYIYTESDFFDCLPRENGLGYRNQWDFVAGLLDGLPFNNKTARHTAARERAIALTWERDWREGVETTLRLKVGRMDPSYVSTRAATPAIHVPEVPYPFDAFRFHSLTGVVRLGWHERAVDFHMRRMHLYSSYPTVFLGAEIGSYAYADLSSADADARYHVYGKLHATVRQQISLGMGGRLTYVASAGIIFGHVPYPLLNLADGNQGYIYDTYRFTLMNSHQYALDKYLTLHAEWNGMGVLFNLIPGVRFLHLRELVECKVAYGGLSGGHYFTDGLKPLSIPYVEVGVGLGNILRLIDIYSVWRITNRNDLSTPLWGIRGRVSLGL